MNLFFSHLFFSQCCLILIQPSTPRCPPPTPSTSGPCQTSPSPTPGALCNQGTACTMPMGQQGCSPRSRGKVGHEDRGGSPGRTGIIPNLVLNVGVDPLQHPLAGVLVRQVRIHLWGARAEHRQQLGTALPCPDTAEPWAWLSQPPKAMNLLVSVHQSSRGES